MAATAIFTYGYDLAGRLISVASPEQGTVTYEYDPAGNLLKRTCSTGADADGDGLTGAQELALGLIPPILTAMTTESMTVMKWPRELDGLNPASRFAIVSAAAVAGGAMEIVVPTVIGRRYSLQSSSTLAGWANEDEAAAIEVPGTGAPVVLRDANPGVGPKYYRVMVSL